VKRDGTDSAEHSELADIFFLKFAARIFFLKFDGTV
jgi:hypothetical protein